MRIEIFVVETEILHDRLLSDNIKGLRCLEEQKIHLIKIFGGLTEINDSKGYYINSKEEIESDLSKIWIIYTKHENIDLTKNYWFDISLKPILLRIKEITRQKSQAYTINNEIYFI